MAYYSGTAASLTALRTALLTHAASDGWALTGDVLSKAGVYFRIQETATNITCLGCESNAVANPAPNVVSIGRVFQYSTFAPTEMTFPCNYEVFGFAQELYLVANYDVSSYQWMAFGKSTVPGLTGQGGWCGATCGEFIIAVFGNSGNAICMTLTGGGDAAASYSVRRIAPALFWNGGSQGLNGTTGSAPRNSWVNHGLDSHGWKWFDLATSEAIGPRTFARLNACQPSAWNSESALLAIRAMKQRPSFKASLVADLENARHIRIDNLSPGDILTLGPDKWKVFPWYKKDASERDAGLSVAHTGTFGWAIRYQGP